MKANVGAIVVWGIIGAMVSGFFCYWIAYESLRSTGMGGGMEGLGRAYNCLGIALLGTIGGAVGGGLMAWKFVLPKEDGKPISPTDDRKTR